MYRFVLKGWHYCIMTHSLLISTCGLIWSLLSNTCSHDDIWRLVLISYWVTTICLLLWYRVFPLDVGCIASFRLNRERRGLWLTKWCHIPDFDLLDSRCVWKALCCFRIFGVWWNSCGWKIASWMRVLLGQCMCWICWCRFLGWLLRCRWCWFLGSCLSGGSFPCLCNYNPLWQLCIIKANKSSLLNKRSELISKCRHENKYYLTNFK